MLNKNPDYICTEKNYTREQSILKASLDSLDKAINVLKNRDELQIVNYSFGIKTTSTDCNSCDGGGYATIANVLNKTFYKHNVGVTPFETIELPDGSTYKSYYGWGSEHLFTQVELDALWESKRISDFEEKPSLEEFLIWCKKPLSLCSIGTYVCVKSRAKELGEESDDCGFCDGSGTIYAQNEIPKNILHLWVINKKTGMCFGIDVENIKDNEIQNSIKLLKSSQCIISEQFKMFLSNEVFENVTGNYNYWNGKINDSTSGWDQVCKYDTFNEFNSEWGEPNDLNELVSYHFTDNGLFLWMLHPRKGCSAHVCIKNITEEDKDGIKSQFKAAIDRVDLVFGNLDK